MKKSIPYIIALVVGVFARSWISAANGWSYTMSGVDLLNALASAGVVYGFKGTFLPRKSTERRKPQRENPDSLRRKPDRML